jgi:RNA polymerase primary sigma factor
MNDIMSDELSDADALETLICLLNDIGITVYDQAPDAETLFINQSDYILLLDNELEDIVDYFTAECWRTFDPVRLYMLDMGAIDLLTREGEIVISKRIEAGQKDMVMALSACPVTITEILGNVDKIASGEMEIDQFVDGLVDPNAENIPLAAEEPDDLEMMDEGDEGDEGYG